MALVAGVAPEGGAGAAGSCSDHDPAGDRVGFGGHLRVHRLGNVVIPPPVRGTLGVGELVQVVAAGFCRQRAGGCIHLTGRIHQVAAPGVELDQLDLLDARGFGDHGDEIQPQHPREVCLGDGC